MLAMLRSPAIGVEIPQHGSWNVITKIERDGTTIAERTNTRCITPEAAKRLEESLTPKPLDPQGMCKRLDFAKTNTWLSWQMRCQGKTTAEVSTRYMVDSPQHYLIVVQTTSPLSGRISRSTLTVEARRIGDCRS
jgi:uncharacterized protein DUF3617